MGKPQGIFNSNFWHNFQVNRNGKLWEGWGAPITNYGVMVTGFLPDADVTIQRIPYEQANPFGTYYGVSARTADGGVGSIYWVGSNWQPANHWEGPVWLSDPDGPTTLGRGVSHGLTVVGGEIEPASEETFEAIRRGLEAQQ